MQVVEKARVACLQSGHAMEDHFGDITKMVDLGSGARHRVTSSDGQATGRAFGGAFGLRGAVSSTVETAPSNSALHLHAPYRLSYRRVIGIHWPRMSMHFGGLLRTGCRAQTPCVYTGLWTLLDSLGY